jgi:membrane protease YdiL (CAAX protease family)
VAVLVVAAAAAVRHRFRPAPVRTGAATTDSGIPVGTAADGPAGSAAADQDGAVPRAAGTVACHRTGTATSSRYVTDGTGAGAPDGDGVGAGGAAAGPPGGAGVPAGDPGASAVGAGGSAAAGQPGGAGEPAGDPGGTAVGVRGRPAPRSGTASGASNGAPMIGAGHPDGPADGGGVPTGPGGPPAVSPAGPVAAPPAVPVAAPPAGPPAGSPGPGTAGQSRRVALGAGRGEPAPDDTVTPPHGVPVLAGGGGGGPDGEATDPALRLPAGPPPDPRLAPWPGPDPRARPQGPAGAGPVASAPVAYPPYGAPPPHPPVTAVRAPAHRWGVGAYLLAQAVFLVVSLVIGLTLFGAGPLSIGVLAVAVAVPGLVAAAAAVVITIVRGNGPFADFQLRWSWRELGIGLAFGFGGLFVSLPASAVYVSVVGEDASSAVGDIFGGLTATPGEALLIASLVVLVVPVCEEILFRGLLWGGLTRLGANAWVTFAVSTVIFALAHFEWPRAILLLVVALPIGLARIHGDGLLAPIVAHQINNLLPGIGLYLMLTGAFPAL